MSGVSSSDEGNFTATQKERVNKQGESPYLWRPAGLDAILRMLPHLPQSDKMRLLKRLYTMLKEPLSEAAEQVSHQDFRRHQASMSFYLLFWSLAVATTLDAIFTLSLVAGDTNPSFVSASGVLTSNALCVCCFKLHKDTNDRLDSCHPTYDLSQSVTARGSQL